MRNKKSENPLATFGRLYTVKADGIAELKPSRLAKNKRAQDLVKELRSRQIVSSTDNSTEASSNQG